MTQEEIEYNITDLFANLGAACNAARALMQLGFMNMPTYEHIFNRPIAHIESQLREIAGEEWQ